MFNASFYHNQKILQQKTGPMTIATDFSLRNKLRNRSVGSRVSNIHDKKQNLD